MSQSALARIQNLKDDDLFFSFDADEIPKPEVRNDYTSGTTDTLSCFHFNCLNPLVAVAQ